jgi:hypothetical protein
MKSSKKEIALCVETPEIMNVIIIDTNRANIIGSKRELGSKNTFTNFRAIGTTVSKTGKAIGQLFHHATIQDVKKSSEKEMVLKVEMPATIDDIVSDTIKLNKIGAKREGSFILLNDAHKDNKPLNFLPGSHKGPAYNHHDNGYF